MVEQPYLDEYGAIYPCPFCGRDSGGPEGAACAECWWQADRVEDERAAVAEAEGE
jgi:hypothetical protein